MTVTVAAGIAAIALLVAVAAVAFGTLTPKPQAASPLTQEKVSVQAPATATADLATAEPAPTAAVTTAAVAGNGIGASSPAAAPVQPAAAAAPTVADAGLGVVVIDAGHQGQGDPSLEWNAPPGPGRKRQPKVESGASGPYAPKDESEVNLQVALKLRTALEARGVKVVMVRTTQNVNIANSERAAIANRNHAALFIRLHCDSAAASVQGVLTLEPEKNWYGNPSMVTKSAKAAKLIHYATLQATGAQDRGIQKRGDLSGFNWSNVPSVLVEMGLMSNATEDRNLVTPSYQVKLADGIANGIISYLKNP